MTIGAGALDRRIRIERPVADDNFDGAGSGGWLEVRRAWANIQDVLPPRGERADGGINMSTRPARLLMRYRSGVTPDMRFVLLVKGAPARIMQIVSGPAEIGRREWMVFQVEDYSPAGNPA